MSGTTNISWADKVWNPVVGCTQVSPGCAHCYAKTLHDKRHAAYREGKLQAHPQFAVPFEQVQTMWGRLRDPLRWRRPCRVFVNSVSDLFHEDVSDGLVMRVVHVMRSAPHHRYMVLTKRAERMQRFFARFADLSGEEPDFKNARGPAAVRAAHPSGRGQLFAAMLDTMGEPPAGAVYPSFDWSEGMRWWPNWMPWVWVGVSVENQRMADARLPWLRQTPVAGVRFVSAEPLLGPVKLNLHLRQHGVGWVIVGGESGSEHRPMELAHAVRLIEECRSNNVPVWVKQDSGPLPGRRGRIPEELFVQEAPAVWL